MAEISVIIPTYNRVNFLSEAIKSILNQIYQDFEIIIIDDGSTDDTENVVAKINDKRIEYIKHQKNKGVAVALNTGIIASKGKYIFFLGDDDLTVPSTLEKLIQKIKQSDLKNLGGVYCWSLVINDEGKTLRIIDSKKKGYIFDEILKKQVFTNLLIKKEVFEKVGLYDENLLSNEDFDFYLRMAKKYQFDFVPEILMVIRSHSQTHLSIFTKRHMRDHADIIKKYSNSWRRQKFLFASLFPHKFYVQLSNFKNFFITQIKLLLNPKIKKEINLIKKTLTGEGIKI